LPETWATTFLTDHGALLSSGAAAGCCLLDFVPVVAWSSYSLLTAGAGGATRLLCKVALKLVHKNAFEVMVHCQRTGCRDLVSIAKMWNFRFGQIQLWTSVQAVDDENDRSKTLNAT
jgi:hypothetical protein